MKRFRTGLVVGKFAPLHLGHEHVIRAALAACDHVILLSYSRPEFSGFEPEKRVSWLAVRFPETTRIVLDRAETELPLNSGSDESHRAFCAEILRREVDLPIDAIFTSEDYGEGFAADLARRQGSAVAHVLVDQSRSIIPVSGTALRADIHGLRRFLAPEVYSDFIQRVAVLGGESTGKSTLSQRLAQEFSTTSVAEYGRELWLSRSGKLNFEDLLEIAVEQIAREEKALLHPSTMRYLFCDTSPLTTLFYSFQLFGSADPKLEKLAQRSYDRLIFCDDDFPFSQDGTRQDEAFRKLGQEFYREKLLGRSYVFLSGSIENRIAQWRTAVGAD